ncbi:uncharacterized protein LOC111023667 [Momordica charantia]|uniref:Uncharacterized protein LOC111023667 n=1 Tax=Momordica charantia TaxID=3673 RepID=A0A6J1DUS4_MOMCH|nr:uncharacterized protein LOC111023667 [Momordica charantia]
MVVCSLGRGPLMFDYVPPLVMRRLFVIYGGKWNEAGTMYEGGVMGGLDVDETITYANLVSALHMLTRIDPDQFDLIVQCVYRFDFRYEVPNYLIFDDSSLKFYLNGPPDPSQVPLYVTVIPKASYGSGSRRGNNFFETQTSSSFPYYPRQNDPCFGRTISIDSPLDDVGLPSFIPQITPLADNVIPCNLDDDESPYYGQLYENEVEYKFQSDDEYDYDEYRTEDGVEGDGGNGYDNGEEDEYHTEDVLDEHYENEGQHVHESHTMSGNAPYQTVEEVVSRPMQNIITGNGSDFIGEIAVKGIFHSKVELRFKLLRAKSIQGGDSFIISKFNDVHKCKREVLNHDHRQARSWVVGQLVKSNLEDVSRQYKPKDIINDMRKNYGVNIRYEKAWMAKNVALNLLIGSPKHSYTLLCKYGEALKVVNAGTVFGVELEEDKYFKYAFMALGCYIRRFSSCIRPVLVIDGAHLKGKYRGVILITSSVDGNNQIYPLAFELVDQESDQSWTWFLNMVKTCIGKVDGLLFVSDRHVCITKSIRQVFPQVAHRICMQHLSTNLKDKFKDDVMQEMFILAVKACRKSEFRYYFSQLAGFPEVQRYLEGIGFEK